MEKLLKKRNILIFFNEDRIIDSYPYVLNLALLLSREYEIDFLVTADMYAPCSFFNLYKASKKSYTKSAIAHLNKYGKTYNFVIAFSIEGIWATQYYNVSHFFHPIPFSYFSMEFFDAEKKSPRAVSLISRLAKNLSMGRPKFSVAQDIARAKCIGKYFDFVDEVRLLPNSYIGFSDKKSDFAYRRFGISFNKKILLFSGALERWNFDINIVKYLEKILRTEEYVLLLSGFSRDNYVEEIYSTYSSFIEQKLVVVNTNMFDKQQYSELVKSAYIGLAWYVKLNKKNLTTLQYDNLYYMGLSSGKLLKYLSCSVPVIVPSYYYGYSDLMKKYAVGEATTGSSMSDKIVKINENYKTYTKNVKKFYTNNLEFEKQSKDVIKQIKLFCR